MTQTVTEICAKLGARTSLKAVGCLNLRYVHPERMFVKLGAARLAGHRKHLGSIKYNTLRLTAYAVALLKRNPRQGAHVNRERTLVERRKEAAAKREENTAGCHKEHTCACKNRTAVPECPAQTARISALHGTRQSRLTAKLALITAIAQQEGAQHRRHRKSHYRRGRKRYKERYAKRLEHTPFHALKEEQRHESRGYNQRRVENRHTHLGRRMVYHPESALALPFGQTAVLAQPLVHILHIHYRVIHKAANRYRYAAEAHGIDSHTHGIEYQHRHYYGERKRYHRYHSRAHVHQEHEQHYYHKERALGERALQITYCAVYEVTLTENVGRHPYIGRQTRLHRI